MGLVWDLHWAGTQTNRAGLICDKIIENKMDPFGFVLLVVILSVFVQMYLGIQVGRARNKYKVPVRYMPCLRCYGLIRDHSLAP